MRLRLILGITCLFPGVALASGLNDPFPVRDLFPLHLLFLDQSPAGGGIQPVRQPQFSWNTTYVNTMVGTDDLVRLYNTDGQQPNEGEVTLGVLQMVADAQPSRTAFVLDSETLRTALQARVGIARRLEIALEVPFLSHQGGFMDPFIDSFHDRLHLPEGGRTGFAQNEFRAGYVGGGEIVYLDDPSSGLHLGDTVMSATGAILIDRGRSPALSMTVSGKAPTGDYHRLEGSGSWDYGAALRISKTFGRSTVHGGIAYSALGKWLLAPRLPLHNSRSLFAAYSYSATPETSVVVQVLRTTGPFPFRSGNDLGRSAMSISAGFRHRLPRGFQVEWSFVENIEPYYNAPDIGTYLGLSYFPSAPPTAPANGSASHLSNP